MDRNQIYTTNGIDNYKYRGIAYVYYDENIRREHHCWRRYAGDNWEDFLEDELPDNLITLSEWERQQKAARQTEAA